MENCYSKVGCLGGLGNNQHCSGAETILTVARDPDEAQSLANAWERKGCQNPSRLQEAVVAVRARNTGGENQIIE